MTNKSTIISLIILMALAFWIVSVSMDNTIEISLDGCNLSVIENVKAVFTKLDSTEQERGIEIPVIDNLSSKALLVSDLPNGSINFVQTGSKKYLMLKNNTLSPGYQEIREEDGLIICRTGSIDHLLDKSGNELPILSEELVKKENAYLDNSIKTIKKQKDRTEEDKNREIAMIERSRGLHNGYQKLAFRGHRLYGEREDELIYIGDL